MEAPRSGSADAGERDGSFNRSDQRIGPFDDNAVVAVGPGAAGAVDRDCGDVGSRTGGNHLASIEHDHPIIGAARRCSASAGDFDVACLRNDQRTAARNLHGVVVARTGSRSADDRDGRGSHGGSSRANRCSVTHINTVIQVAASIAAGAGERDVAVRGLNLGSRTDELHADIV